jgi:hypothetical protein
MKKLFSFLVLITTVSFLSKANLQIEINDASQVKSEEGIRCRIYNDAGNLVASCWFCSCNNLAKGALNK